MIHLNVLLQNIESAAIVLSLWSDTLLMECNAEATVVWLHQGSCQKWVMKMLDAVTLICACEALFHMKLLFSTPGSPQSH